VLGRTDDIINIGGIKLVPGPIEADCLAVAGVCDVAVVGMTDRAGVAELVAAVVLAPHAVGHRVVVVDELPRTEIGKLRRGAAGQSVMRASEEKYPAA
jgi:long-chain acyl-CoA synthetase